MQDLGHHGAVAAAVLGQVKGVVGVAHQFFGRLAVFAVGRHADRDGDLSQRQVAMLDVEAAHGRADFLGALLRLFSIGFRHQDREFLATIAAAHIFAAHDAA